MPEPAKTRPSSQRELATDASTAATEPAVTVTDDEAGAVQEPVGGVVSESSAAEAVAEEAVAAESEEDAAAAEEDEIGESDAAAEVSDEIGESDAAGQAPKAKPAAKSARKPAAPAKPAASTPVDKRKVERDLKAAEKQRIATEQARRKAEFQAARIRQQDADRVQLWADRRQAQADKARESLAKASAKAEAVRTAAGENPTGLAARRVAAAERWEVYSRQELDKTQSDADALRKRARKAGVHSTLSAGKVSDPGSRQWVPPTFISVGLLGVVWLVVYYITASTGINVPGMTSLEGWNVIIGMGLMASSFGIATLWK